MYFLVTDINGDVHRTRLQGAGGQLGEHGSPESNLRRARKELERTGALRLWHSEKPWTHRITTVRAARVELEAAQ